MAVLKGYDYENQVPKAISVDPLGQLKMLGAGVANPNTTLATDANEVTFLINYTPGSDQPPTYNRASDGSLYTPVPPIVPVANTSVESKDYEAITTVSGEWATGDQLTRKVITANGTDTVFWLDASGDLLGQVPVIGVDCLSNEDNTLLLLKQIRDRLSLSAPTDGQPALAGTRTVARLMAYNGATFDLVRVSIGKGLITSGASNFITATVQRAANTTAYLANDIIGTKMTLSSVAAANSRQYLLRADLILNIAALPSGIGDLRLFLFNADPTTTTIADNGVFSLSASDRTKLVFPAGISLGTPELILGGGTVVCQPSPANMPFVMGATANLWAVLVTAAGFTPAANSETYTLRLHFVEV